MTSSNVTHQSLVSRETAELPRLGGTATTMQG